SQLIYDEAIQLINITDTKRITDKQAIYITNTVIIPTIKYRLYNIILKHSTCDNIFSKYLTMVKHKAKLSHTSPNSTMLNPYIYNIYNIWDIQLQYHISCFQQRINNSEVLGISTKIRLQQLQNNLWSATNILQHSQPLIDGPNKLTLNFKIIQLLQHLGISIIANSNVIWPNTTQDGHQPLEPILNQHPKYNTFRKQLRKNNILFLEQLCTADNSTLLKWHHLSPRLHHLTKGKQPLWFTFLEDNILSDRLHHSILSYFHPPGVNAFAYNTLPIKEKLNLDYLLIMTIIRRSLLANS